MNYVSATFQNRIAAERAITEIERTGIQESQISVIMSEAGRSMHFVTEKSSKVDEGAAAGAGVGGLIGAIAGSVLSAGVIAVPGLNLIATGAIVSSLAGLGAGGLLGGVVGGLVGAGIPEYEAKKYEAHLRDGDVLVVVNPATEEQAESVRYIFQHNDAQDIAAE
jgi:phage tail tape-measure protein